jgi:hypothetical protein
MSDASALQIARGYLKRGWNPIPVSRRTKKPIGFEWQKRRLDHKTVAEVFNGADLNVGVQLGTYSGGLTDVDLDCKEALLAGPLLLKKSNNIFGRASKPRSHWLYNTTLADKIDKACLQFRDPVDGAMMLELKIGGGGKGSQSVFPGSTHASGEKIAWDEDGVLVTVDDDKLLDCVKRLAVAVLLARHWPSKGGRHDAALTVGGFLARADFDADQAEEMMAAIIWAADDDDELADRMKAVRDAVAQYANGGETRGLPAMVEAFGEKVVQKAAEWLGYKQTRTDKKTHTKDEEEDETDTEITRLAKLSMMAYEQQRKAAAKKLDVRINFLDMLVRAKRVELGLDSDDDDGRQGHAVTFPEVEPWPEEVDGAALLDDIVDAICTFIAMRLYKYDICALWVIHTYLVKHFRISPKISIRSPMRRCGKSTLLEIFNELVFRAWSTGNITKAALFRVIEMWHPTLLVDEVDTFVGEDEELRGIINNSHKYDGSVTRTVGEGHEPRKFSVYGAVALSGIGGLAATLADRSVTIDLKRKRPGEKVTKLRFKHIEQLHELRRRIVRWIADHEESIAKREPEMPSIIDDDREADNWEVLLAIADEVGGEVWPDRARRAAKAAHAAMSDDDVALLELLLADIRDAFATHGTKAHDEIEIASLILVGVLNRRLGRPWAEIGKNGKEMTQNKLARMLKAVVIAPVMIGPTNKRLSGYQLGQFRDAFERYLPAEGDSNLTSSHNPVNTGTSDDSKPHIEDNDVRLENARNPITTGSCEDVRLRRGGNGKDTESTPRKRGGARSRFPASRGLRVSTHGGTDSPAIGRSPALSPCPLASAQWAGAAPDRRG